MHDFSMENQGFSNYEIPFGTFEKVMEKIKKGKMKTYDFLMNSGDVFKECVYKLCTKMIKEENCPTSFNKTNLVQI